MICEKYRDALLEAAAGPGECTKEVRDHVQACPECRATLQREQTLLATIDEALRARVAELPQADFLADVRAQILQQPAPRLVMSPMWTLAAASMVVTLVVIAGLWPKLHERPQLLSNTMTPASRISPEKAIGEPQRREPAHVHRTGAARKQAVQKNPDREPEVLVPPDEREALARFVSHLRQGDEVARAFVQPQPQERGELSEIRPVEIARLQVKPLAWESWK